MVRIFTTIRNRNLQGFTSYHVNFLDFNDLIIVSVRFQEYSSWDLVILGDPPNVAPDMQLNNYAYKHLIVPVFFVMS